MAVFLEEVAEGYGVKPKDDVAQFMPIPPCLQKFNGIHDYVIKIEREEDEADEVKMTCHRCSDTIIIQPSFGRVLHYYKGRKTHEYVNSPPR